MGHLSQFIFSQTLMIFVFMECCFIYQPKMNHGPACATSETQERAVQNGQDGKVSYTCS